VTYQLGGLGSQGPGRHLLGAALCWYKINFWKGFKCTNFSFSLELFSVFVFRSPIWQASLKNKVCGCRVRKLIKCLLKTLGQIQCVKAAVLIQFEARTPSGRKKYFITPCTIWCIVFCIIIADMNPFSHPHGMRALPIEMKKLFHQNGSSNCREPHASADGVNVCCLIHTLKELSQHLNVKWTMQHSLHYWDDIIKLIIIIACYTQYIYFF